MLVPACDPGLTRSFPFPQLFQIAVATMVALVPSLPHCAAAQRASSIVQSALRAEIALNVDERARLLDAALLRDPKSPEAHWARGEVRIHGHWLSLEDAASDASVRANLEQYQEQRRQADGTVEGQVRMAEYSHKHRLPAQELAHWTAVVALAPNHTVARQRLGQVNVAGAWIDERQLERQKKTEQATSRYMLKHGKDLFRLSNALYEKSLSHERVVMELGEFRNPSVIPGLEYFLSSRGEDGGLCTVETLASLPAPEASLSLVRHALDFPIESVRVAATKSLKKRDEHSFIPVLLAALQNPVQKRDQFSITRGNLLIWRQSFSVETQAAKKIATLDRVFPLPGVIPASAVATANWTQQAILSGNLEVQRLNRNIESNNDRVIELLTKINQTKSTTRIESEKNAERKTSPEEWWDWWNDRVESYPADIKEVQVRYEVVFVPPSIPEFPSGIRNECLAPGTLIWTETGPVAVDRVKAGDLVLTQNQRSGELKFAPVLATTNRLPELLLRLNFGDETVRATGGHPFWVSGKGWLKARSLKPGMGLHTASGVVLLESIEEEQEPTKAYNLIVDECHSYFVGTNRIFSHDNTVREPVANRVPGLRDDIVARRGE